MTPGESAVFGSRESHSVSASKSKVSMTAQRAPFGHGDDGIRFVKGPSLRLARTPERQVAPDDTPGTYWTPVSGHRHCLRCARSRKTCRHWNFMSVHGLLDSPARAREGGNVMTKLGTFRPALPLTPLILMALLTVGQAADREVDAQGDTELARLTQKIDKTAADGDADRVTARIVGEWKGTRFKVDAASAPGALTLQDVQNLRAKGVDRKSTRLNSSHSQISYAVFCLKKKKQPVSAYS